MNIAMRRRKMAFRKSKSPKIKPMVLCVEEFKNECIRVEKEREERRLLIEDIALLDVSVSTTNKVLDERIDYKDVQENIVKYSNDVYLLMKANEDFENRVTELIKQNSDTNSENVKLKGKIMELEHKLEVAKHELAIQDEMIKIQQKENTELQKRIACSPNVGSFPRMSPVFSVQMSPLSPPLFPMTYR